MTSFFKLAALGCAVLTMQIASAQGTVAVEIRPTAILRTDGHFVFVRVRVTCETTADVLEAFVNVSQAGAFGEGALNPECDGQEHGHLVRVQSFDGVFVRGEAQASAFILICDELGNCIDGQASRVINLRGSSQPSG